MSSRLRTWIPAGAVGVALATSALAAGDDPPPPVIGAPAVGGTIPPAAPPEAPPGTAPAPGPDSTPSTPPPEPALTCEQMAEVYGDTIARCEQALIQATDEVALRRAEAARAELAALADRSPAPEESPGGREHVASIVKGMKPRDAAAMVAQWDDGLAADVLARLAPRVAAPVFAAMPPATAARITARIAERGRR